MTSASEQARPTLRDPVIERILGSSDSTPFLFRIYQARKGEPVTFEQLWERALHPLGRLMQELLRGYVDVEIHDNPLRQGEQLEVGKLHLSPTQDRRMLTGRWVFDTLGSEFIDLNSPNLNNLYQGAIAGVIITYAQMHSPQEVWTDLGIHNFPINFERYMKNYGADITNGDVNIPFVTRSYAKVVLFQHAESYILKEKVRLPEIKDLPPDLPRSVRELFNAFDVSRPNATTEPMRVLVWDDYAGAFYSHILKADNQVIPTPSGAPAEDIYLIPESVSELVITSGHSDQTVAVDLTKVGRLTIGEMPLIRNDLQAWLVDLE